VPARLSARIGLAVELEKKNPERLPDAISADILGIRLPKLLLDPFHVSTPAKLRLLSWRLQEQADQPDPSLTFDTMTLPNGGVEGADV